MLNITYNKKNGITLIALVISIIVLLILSRSNCVCNYWQKWNNKHI
jgi:hypothetical protein